MYYLRTCLTTVSEKEIRRGTGVRVFLIEDDGQVKRISVKRFQKLLDGVQDVEQLPEYAGQRLGIAFVTLEVEGGPVAIGRIDRAIVSIGYPFMISMVRAKQLTQIAKLPLATLMFSTNRSTHSLPAVPA